MSKLVVVSGTGLEKLVKDSAKTKEVKTPFGSATIIEGKLAGRELLYISRHGPAHDLLPHEINYRANMFAALENGGTHVLSIAAVGTVTPERFLKKGYRPGDIAMVRDILIQSGLPSAFDAKELRCADMHTPMGQPFSMDFINLIISASEKVNIYVKNYEKKAVLADPSGPWFETKADIIKLQRDGANFVGMTSTKETLALRELAHADARFERKNATLVIVTNYGTGLSVKEHDHKEVGRMVQKREQDVITIVTQVLDML